MFALDIDTEVPCYDLVYKLLQRVIYIFFYLFGKQNGACNLLHGEVILKGLNRKQTEFIAVPNIYYVVLVMDIQQYITESKVRRRT
ncbi:hypothetical protein NQ315_000538 [Exocentrus adspersus]|uniref:Uncharacterized protein n=1 Tax=Exocentrus adspersus TaxID=1586481 RepID=A0AAV8V8F1_9CUCU|nr:hypothetical protein NQ315_000538 [Exocentrus adspersus]